jgi:hypothetical protein
MRAGCGSNDSGTSGLAGAAEAGVPRERPTIFARAPCGFVFLAVRFATFLAVAFARFFFAGFFFAGFFFAGFFLEAARRFFAGAALRFFAFRFAVVFRPRRPVAMSSPAGAHGRAIARPVARHYPTIGARGKGRLAC